MKVKWAISETDDVAKFKADIAGHTESIQMLLATVQMSVIALELIANWI